VPHTRDPRVLAAVLRQSLLTSGHGLDAGTQGILDTALADDLADSDVVERQR